MGTINKLNIEITYDDDDFYHIKVNGNELKMCKNYNELAECMGSVVKSHCKRGKEKYGYR